MVGNVGGVVLIVGGLGVVGVASGVLPNPFAKKQDDTFPSLGGSSDGFFDPVTSTEPSGPFAGSPNQIILPPAPTPNFGDPYAGSIQGDPFVAQGFIDRALKDGGKKQISSELRDTIIRSGQLQSRLPGSQKQISPQLRDTIIKSGQLQSRLPKDGSSKKSSRSLQSKIREGGGYQSRESKPIQSKAPVSKKEDKRKSRRPYSGKRPSGATGRLGL